MKIRIPVIPYRLISNLLILVGAVIGCSVIYFFLFTSAPIESTQIQETETVVKKGTIERVSTWVSTKQADAAKRPVVPGGVFATPAP